MPHITSAKKRLRQSKVRRVRNRAVLADLRTSIKKLLKAIKSSDKAGAVENLKIVHGKLDKCGIRRYLHPNTAQRYKSRLAKRVQKLG
jgi:small subunit ribosomal protein S20